MHSYRAAPSHYFTISQQQLHMHKHDLTHILVYNYTHCMYCYIEHSWSTVLVCKWADKVKTVWGGLGHVWLTEEVIDPLHFMTCGGTVFCLPEPCQCFLHAWNERNELLRGACVTYSFAAQVTYRWIVVFKVEFSQVEHAVCYCKRDAHMNAYMNQSTAAHQWFLLQYWLAHCSS